MIGIQVFASGNNLAMKFPYDPILVEKIRGMPQRKWNKDKKQWEFKPTLVNIEYVQKWFPQAEWDNSTEQFVDSAILRRNKREEIASTKNNDAWDYSALEGVPFKMEPLDHQKRALLLGRDAPSFAYLMDQGTGKTKVTIDDAAHNWREGRIDAMLVIAPNSVKSNWVDSEDTFSVTNNPGDMDEITKHMADDVPVNKGAWVSSQNKREKKLYKEFRSRWDDTNCLHILVVNVEAIHVARVFAEVMEFVRKFRCMIVVDESTRIKNRTAKRTKNSIKARRECPIARILSGTPLIKSPLDAFSQFNFLDEDILGFTNYYSFQHHFAVMGGYEGYQVLFYKNLEELKEKVDSVSYRVLKEECLKLPPKEYIKRKVELTPAQRKAYEDMLHDMRVDLGDKGEVAVNIVLTQLLRLQQITGGYLPQIDPETKENVGTVELVDPSKNPKFKEVLNIIDESGEQKIIIWCRFRDEIAGLCSLLEHKGITHLQFHGGISTTDRREYRKRFFSDPSIKCIVGNQDAGGIGIDEFKAASIVIYVSNSYSTENRVQSEDRSHRIGSEVHDLITYFDIPAINTVDGKVISCLRENRSISRQIIKEGWQKWI